MSNIAVDRLDALAKAATPGPWSELVLALINERVALLKERDELRARVSDLEQAIRFVLSNRPGHYTHVDPKGTAGRNCPACISDGLNCSTLREALCANKPTNTPGGDQR